MSGHYLTDFCGKLLKKMAQIKKENLNWLQKMPFFLDKNVHFLHEKENAFPESEIVFISVEIAKLLCISVFWETLGLILMHDLLQFMIQSNVQWLLSWKPIQKAHSYSRDSDISILVKWKNGDKHCF